MATAADFGGVPLAADVHRRPLRGTGVRVRTCWPGLHLGPTVRFQVDNLSFVLCLAPNVIWKFSKKILRFELNFNLASVEYRTGQMRRLNERGTLTSQTAETSRLLSNQSRWCVDWRRECWWIGRPMVRRGRDGWRPFIAASIFALVTQE